MTLHEEQQAMVLLNGIRAINPSQITRLLEKFQSAAAMVRGGPSAWKDVLPDHPHLDQITVEFEASRKEAELEWEFVQREKIKIYLLHSGPYPAWLREISSPPPVLFVQGDDLGEESRSLAMVGSRRCTYYGEKITRSLSNDLAQVGIVTVSGLARGIDSAVHDQTLRSGGKTWAVLGCGLSHCYPPENIKLLKKVSEQGAVISEFSFRTRPYPGNFPRRNRIIAGLTFGTIVVEGTEKSGSLITARLAGEEGRQVFAVPGPITSPLSGAPHALIQSGAKLVRNIVDIFEELPDSWGIKRPGPSGVEGPSPANKEEAMRALLSPPVKEILEHLNEGPLLKEILTQRLDTTAQELTTLLVEMEIQGLIRSLPGGFLVRA